MPRVSCKGSSSQPLEHNLILAPENHGGHFNAPHHASLCCSYGFCTSPAGGEHNCSYEKGPCWILPGWCSDLRGPNFQGQLALSITLQFSLSGLHLSQQGANRHAAQMGWGGSGCKDLPTNYWDVHYQPTTGMFTTNQLLGCSLPTD